MANIPSLICLVLATGSVILSSYEVGSVTQKRSVGYNFGSHHLFRHLFENSGVRRNSPFARIGLQQLGPYPNPRPFNNTNSGPAYVNPFTNSGPTNANPFTHSGPTNVNPFIHSGHTNVNPFTHFRSANSRFEHSGSRNFDPFRNYRSNNNHPFVNSGSGDIVPFPNMNHNNFNPFRNVNHSGFDSFRNLGPRNFDPFRNMELANDNTYEREEVHDNGTDAHLGNNTFSNRNNTLDFWGTNSSTTFDPWIVDTNNTSRSLNINITSDSGTSNNNNTSDSWTLSTKHTSNPWIPATTSEPQNDRDVVNGPSVDLESENRRHGPFGLGNFNHPFSHHSRDRFRNLMSEMRERRRSMLERILREGSVNRFGGRFNWNN